MDTVFAFSCAYLRFFNTERCCSFLFTVCVFVSLLISRKQQLYLFFKKSTITDLQFILVCDAFIVKSGGTCVRWVHIRCREAFTWGCSTRTGWVTGQKRESWTQSDVQRLTGGLYHERKFESEVETANMSPPADANANANVEQKVLQYEQFINEVLRRDLQ